MVHAPCSPSVTTLSERTFQFYYGRTFSDLYRSLPATNTIFLIIKPHIFVRQELVSIIVISVAMPC